MNLFGLVHTPMYPQLTTQAQNHVCYCSNGEPWPKFDWKVFGPLLLGLTLYISLFDNIYISYIHCQLTYIHPYTYHIHIQHASSNISHIYMAHALWMHKSRNDHGPFLINSNSQNYYKWAQPIKSLHVMSPWAPSPWALPFGPSRWNGPP